MYIAIIDSDPLIHTQLDHILKHDTIDYFPDGHSFIHSLHEKNYDAIFLEVELPDMMGYELGERIRWKCDSLHCPIIYLSFKTEYAINLFSTQPFDFIQKPIDPQAIHHLMKRLEFFHFAQSIPIVHSNAEMRLRYTDIIYIESQAPRLCYYCRSGEHESYGKLSCLDLPEDRFLRIHQSYIVNLGYVASFSPRTIHLFSGEELPVSRKYQPLIKEYIARLDSRVMDSSFL